MINIPSRILDPMTESTHLVYDENSVIDFRINERNSKLAALLKKYEVTSAGCITPYNPYNIMQKDSLNRIALASLEKQMASVYTHLPVSIFHRDCFELEKKGLMLMGINPLQLPILGMQYYQYLCVSVDQEGFPTVCVSLQHPYQCAKANSYTSELSPDAYWVHKAELALEKQENNAMGTLHEDDQCFIDLVNWLETTAFDVPSFDSWLALWNRLPGNKDERPISPDADSLNHMEDAYSLRQVFLAHLYFAKEKGAIQRIAEIVDGWPKEVWEDRSFDDAKPF